MRLQFKLIVLQPNQSVIYITVWGMKKLSESNISGVPADWYQNKVGEVTNGGLTVSDIAYVSFYLGCATAVFYVVIRSLIKRS